VVPGPDAARYGTRNPAGPPLFHPLQPGEQVGQCIGREIRRGPCGWARLVETALAPPPRCALLPTGRIKLVVISLRAASASPPEKWVVRKPVRCTARWWWHGAQSRGSDATPGLRRGRREEPARDQAPAAQKGYVRKGRSLAWADRSQPRPGAQAAFGAAD
jgi:hypothetical protein